MRDGRHVLAIGRYRREPGAVARARKSVAEAYAACPGIDHFVLALLVSEAATNAVVHSDGPDFYVLCHAPSPVDGSVQVEVHDSGPGLPRRREPAETEELAEGGRGLVLLDDLAAHWRTEKTANGKSLIFTLKGDMRSA